MTKNKPSNQKKKKKQQKAMEAKSKCKETHWDKKRKYLTQRIQWYNFALVYPNNATTSSFS